MEPPLPARRRAHCPRARSSVHWPCGVANWQLARGVRCRARAPVPLPNGAIRERHDAAPYLVPTPRGGGLGGLAVFTAPPTVSFIPGSRRRAPLRSARRSRQGGTSCACVVSARDSVLRGLHRLSPGLHRRCRTGPEHSEPQPEPRRSVLGSCLLADLLLEHEISLEKTKKKDTVAHVFAQFTGTGWPGIPPDAPDASALVS